MRAVFAGPATGMEENLQDLCGASAQSIANRTSNARWSLWSPEMLRWSRKLTCPALTDAREACT